MRQQKNRLSNEGRGICFPFWHPSIQLLNTQNHSPAVFSAFMSLNYWLNQRLNSHAKILYHSLRFTKASPYSLRDVCCATHFCIATISLLLHISIADGGQNDSKRLSLYDFISLRIKEQQRLTQMRFNSFSQQQRKWWRVTGYSAY